MAVSIIQSLHHAYYRMLLCIQIGKEIAVKILLENLLIDYEGNLKKRTKVRALEI